MITGTLMIAGLPISATKITKITKMERRFVCFVSFVARLPLIVEPSSRRCELQDEARGPLRLRVSACP